EMDRPVYGGTPRVLSRDSRIPSPRPVHWRPASPRPRRSTRGVVVPVRVGLVRPTERVGRPLAADTGVRAGPAVDSRDQPFRGRRHRRLVLRDVPAPAVSTTLDLVGHL